MTPDTPSNQSTFTTISAERDFESELGGLSEETFGSIANGEEAVHFCLLAEFDVDAGATLAHQYPYPTGTDEQ